MACHTPPASSWSKSQASSFHVSAFHTVSLKDKGCFLFFLAFFKKINLLLATLGLRCCARAFSSCCERGLLFVAMRRFLIAVASLVAEHRL